MRLKDKKSMKPLQLDRILDRGDREGRDLGEDREVLREVGELRE